MGKIESATMKLVVPDITPTQNVWQRMHWAKRAKLKKRWQSMLVAEYRWRVSHASGPALGPPRADARRRVQVFRHSLRSPDSDNLVSPAGKLILDPLRAKVKKKVGGKMMMIDGPIRLIYDDDPEHVIFDLTSIRVSHRDDQQTVILVSDL